MNEKDKNKKFEDRKASFSMNSNFKDPKLYLMNPEQMGDQTYPTCIMNLPNTAKKFEQRVRSDGWIETSRERGLEGDVKVLGVDCEMVRWSSLTGLFVRLTRNLTLPFFVSHSVLQKMAQSFVESP
jgi:hypothetical protein